MTKFVEVGGSSISIETALQWRLLAGDNTLEEQTASAVAVMKYAAENNIEVSSDDIQSFFDEWRYANELEGAEATQLFLKEHGLNEQSAIQFSQVGALRNKIRESIDDSKVEEYFNENKSEYDVVELYSITVENKDLADEIVSQLEDEEESFYNLAVEHSIDDETFKKGGYAGEVGRSMVPAEAEAALFSASEGDIVGPIQFGEDWVVYKVLRVFPGNLDDVRETIRDELFESLLLAIQGDYEVKNNVLGTQKAVMEDEDEE